MVILFGDVSVNTNTGAVITHSCVLHQCAGFFTIKTIWGDVVCRGMCILNGGNIKTE